MKNSIYKVLLSLICIIYASLVYGQSLTPHPDFIGTEMLGRPTNNSITINVIPRHNMAVQVKYGTTESMSLKTSTYQVTSEDSFEIVLEDLLPNTQYYYRLKWKNEGSTEKFLNGDMHSFHTARTPGEEFVFTVQADLHLDDPFNNDEDQKVLIRCIRNQVADNPDFVVDLGDTFMSGKLTSQYGLPINEANVINRHLIVRQFFNEFAGEIPLFLTLGNHEAESGWLLKNNDTNTLPIWATNARKKYYPNPAPNDFYSGGTSEEPNVGVRESYYAYHWGDALIVVLDPFWYTTTKPGTGDLWDWTLGKEQYTWLRNTLEESDATFKFVFCHHLVGGDASGSGRGGAEFADLYEWGGHDLNGTYAFDEKRPGWGKPIHQLFVENNVSVFFHGHDHFFCKEEKDGVIYQLAPQPSHPKVANNVNVNLAEEYGYLEGVLIASSGHLRITVNPNKATVDYIKAYTDQVDTSNPKVSNGELSYSYSIDANVTPGSNTDTEDTPTKDVSGLIAHSFDAIYPNPMNNTMVDVDVSLVKDENITFHLISTTGQEIKNGDLGTFPEGKNTIQIDLGSISTGHYILVLRVGDEYYEGKRIVIGNQKK